MNGVNTAGFRAGLPAISVLRLSANRPIPKRQMGSDAGDEVLSAAIKHPPRTGETRPIAAFLPEVLARYGLAEAGGGARPIELDMLA
jgi:hypothetical protein